MSSVAGSNKALHPRSGNLILETDGEHLRKPRAVSWVGGARSGEKARHSPVHAIRVTRGGLEPSAIGEFSSLTGDVTSEITEDDWERGRARQKFVPRVEKLFSPPVLENFRRSFSLGPTDCPGFPRMDLKRSRQNKIKRCLLLFCFIF